MSGALLIIDVQQALSSGQYAAFEAPQIINNINVVSNKAREAGLAVLVIQHESEGEPLRYQSHGWQLAAGLKTVATDIFIRKTATDSFHKTDLHAQLQVRGVTELIVCGFQSDFCVDTTTRRALALGYPVTLVSDGHSTLDNSVLKAEQIRSHHNETLANISSFGVRVTLCSAAQFLVQS